MRDLHPEQHLLEGLLLEPLRYVRHGARAVISALQLAASLTWMCNAITVMHMISTDASLTTTDDEAMDRASCWDICSVLCLFFEIYVYLKLLERPAGTKSLL
ncbi:hypothetical protein Droror1_Dr00013769 [Drosera rotundifolia]